MPFAAKEEMLASPSAEEIFSLAAGVAALETRIGENAIRGEKPHQGIFVENRSTYVSAMWVKWSATHQVSECCASETVLGTTNYLYDGMRANSNVIEETDASGNLLMKYIHGGAVDEPLAELFGSAIDYYDADGLGSITSLSNSAGTLTNTYVFDAYASIIDGVGHQPI